MEYFTHCRYCYGINSGIEIVIFVSVKPILNRSYYKCVCHFRMNCGLQNDLLESACQVISNKLCDSSQDGYVVPRNSSIVSSSLIDLKLAWSLHCMLNY